MDANILLLIAALIIGFFIGWLLARRQAGATIAELESRVRTAQLTAEDAKLDFTNAQSELAVKASHINTLNAHIGILEEKLRRVEQEGAALSATIAQLQDELHTATHNRPILEVELRQCQAELNVLKAQLSKALAQADDLRAQIVAEETEREIAMLRAEFAAQTTQGDGAQLQAAPMTSPEEPAEGRAAAAEPATVAEAESDADQAMQAAKAEFEAHAAALQNEILSLRSSLAELALAGEEVVAAYDQHKKEYEDRQRRTVLELQAQLAAAKSELDAIVADKSELEARLEARAAELEALR
ncbi:MAG: hypothetical protein RML99_02725, partial [Anaerolineae bacterium]|nr:hypothetical protein [Anaerolineae bacterium]